MNAEERLKADGFEGVAPVLFYGHRGTDWPYFSNFSRHGFELPCPFTGKLKWYATGEHRYQAMKAITEYDHEHVRLSSGPGRSKDRGRKIYLREQWGDTAHSYAYYVMLEVVLTKAATHPEVRRSLNQTGILPIYEDSPTDDIWGWRCAQDYRGKNLLGKCWMQARSIL